MDCTYKIRSGELDHWCWHYDKKGRYSVKSAYWLAMQQSSQSGSCNTTQTISQKGWLHLVGEGVPKVLLFAWRCYGLAFPTQFNLHRRWVEVDSLCAVCGNVEGGVELILVDCPFTRLVWGLVFHPLEMDLEERS
ncbi:UNVERIFIED_CONTAM: hypothetical protein Slati_1491000 [Sesamum latifolium]|uniref:Reverse transcriptase zinc-binding domain-containing protein n=1 Tax=Sesamum latifolium TaxID=2727402 RepID=A0AAW2X6U2_9LAMI